MGEGAVKLVVCYFLRNQVWRNVHALGLEHGAKGKGTLYIVLRDAYQRLYMYEAENQKALDMRMIDPTCEDYPDNKVDVIIYAVEKSLDSYKFNLMHCKQTFTRS